MSKRPCLLYSMVCACVSLKLVLNTDLNELGWAGKLVMFYAADS